MRVARRSVALCVLSLQSVACSSETGIQGIFETGGGSGAASSPSLSGGSQSSGGLRSYGGVTSAGRSSGGRPSGNGGADTGGSGGINAIGGTSSSVGGAVAASGGSSTGGQSGAPGDGGLQPTCSSALSGQPCAAGASCTQIAPDGCSAVTCVCNSGMFACAHATLSCGKCPVAQEARCGDSCTVTAQRCLCTCGGQNYSGCSCSAGKWQCLGC
jgi:hypothetical protein